MGTINYKHSDYITIGYDCNNFDDEDDFTYYYCDAIFENIQALLNQYDFYYFHVALKPGYYEGFSIDIEFNFSYCLDSWLDRRDAQKEITRIYKTLTRLINEYGLCAVSPGWCTHYYNYNDTMVKLKQAIKEMRETVNSTPTWAQVQRAGEY